MLKEINLDQLDGVAGGCSACGCQPQKRYSQATIRRWREWDRQNPQAAARLHRRQAQERARCAVGGGVQLPRRRPGAAVGDIEAGGALD